MPAQSDTFWHLRAGADILRTGDMPRVEVTRSRPRAGPGATTNGSGNRLRTAPITWVDGAAHAVVGGAGVGAVALSYRLTTGPLATRFLLVAVGLPLSIAAWVTRPHLVTLAAVPLLLTWLVRERPGRFRCCSSCGRTRTAVWRWAASF